MDSSESILKKLGINTNSAFPVIISYDKLILAMELYAMQFKIPAELIRSLHFSDKTLILEEL